MSSRYWFSGQPTSDVVVAPDWMQAHMNQAWVLGIIPWFGWRRLFLQVVKEKALQEAGPVDRQSLYIIANEAAIEAHFENCRIPGEQDRIELENFLAKEVDHDLKVEVGELFSTPTPFGRYPDHHAKLNAFFYCRVLLSVIKELKLLLFAYKYEMFWEPIVVSVIKTIKPFEMHSASLICEARWEIKDDHVSLPAYRFLNWQYLSRNPEYRAMLNAFVRLIQERTFNGVFLNQFYYEYDLIIPAENGHSDDQSTNLILESLEKFGIFPSWPIGAYTSEYILRRMINGKFKFWERDTPPALGRFVRELMPCNMNPVGCAKAITIEAPFGGHKIWKCPEECLIEANNQRVTNETIKMHELRPRMRKESLRRMIGLFIWDMIDLKHAKTISEARLILADTLFPENNPYWHPSKSTDYKKANNDSDFNWCDFREQCLDLNTISKEYHMAAACIESREILTKYKKIIT